MASFVVDRVIAATPEQVWEVLAEVGKVSGWNPTLQSSELTSEAASGEGATRHSVFKDGHSIDERVINWEEPRTMTFRMTSTDLPFKQFEVRFALVKEYVGTRVSAATDYQMKMGLIGILIDFFKFQAEFRGTMLSMLDGLKSEVEGRK